MKFQVIVADPPWAPSDKLTMSDVKRGAESNYNILSTDDLCALKVKEMADSKGCVLVLWVLGSMLEDGLRVMKSWGFDQKQVFVWVKRKKNPLGNLKKAIKIIPSLKKDVIYDKSAYLNVIKSLSEVVDNISLNDVFSFGMGRLFRQTHEICLVGINNTAIYKSLENKSQRSVCFDFNKGHSTKPEILQDRLDLMFPKQNKLEMFARRNREGWVTIGNEVSQGEDIIDSINKLIK